MVQRPGPPLEARGGKNPQTTIMLMSSRMSRLRLVLAGALSRYPQGAGHWACFLQYRDFTWLCRTFGLREGVTARHVTIGRSVTIPFAGTAGVEAVGPPS
jgi:hypothetical protein